MPKNMIHESWCSNKPHLLHVTKYILSHSELFATFFAVHPDILFKIVFWLLSEMSDLVKVACLWSPCCSSHLPFHWSTGALWKVHHMIQEKLLPVLIKNLNPTCKPFSCPFSRSWSQGPFSAQLSQISPQRCIQHLLLQPCLPLWPSNRNTLEMVRIPGTNKIEQETLAQLRSKIQPPMVSTMKTLLLVPCADWRILQSHFHNIEKWFEWMLRIFRSHLSHVSVISLRAVSAPTERSVPAVRNRSRLCIITYACKMM